MKSYRHILCATDFSPNCDRACVHASKLANEAKAKLTLLHVVDHFPVDRSNEEIAPEDVDPQTYAEQQARIKLEKEAPCADLPGAQREILVSEHAAAHEIVEFAAANDVDLIIVASHGHKGIFAEFGSTAKAVQHHARCDVEVVPAKED